MSTSPIELRFRPISATATIPLRHLVLWPSIPADQQLVPEYDFEPTTIHLGTFLSPSPSDTDTSTSTSTDTTHVGSGTETGVEQQESSDSSEPLSLTHLSQAQQDGKEPIAILTLVHHDYPKPNTLPSHIRSSNPASALPTTQIQLHKFAVHPILQGKGVGRKSLFNAIDHLKSHQSQPTSSQSEQTKGTAEKEERGKVFFHFDARLVQRRFYEKCGMEVLDEQVFEKFGTTGKEPGVKHIRMGNII
ncbi:hypothetical protein CI109_104832 [Kwoniella shandongensis]|uniref:Uncharacterized protein n=1 Tax=Kwoniella shandongensis TaxID=1734106 RepID=A0A5M6BRH3_9TREE|nr:uncharacterized protein CI109_006185 [Kwoniella shandongensis]KAA5525494.1 hypothetical protein CI109_006185 [Kwoniella shandongensis]